MKKLSKEVIATLIVTTIYFLCIFLIYDVTYELNDDVMIINILSGRISGASGASYYLSLELGTVLSMLYRLIPVMPWYGLFMVSLYIISFGMIFYKAVSFSEKKELKIAAGIFSVVLFTALFIRGFVLLHYTVVAAVAGAVGILILITGDKKKKTDWIISISLFLISYLIRENVGFMLLPFGGLAFLYAFIFDKETAFKERLKKYLKYAGIFLGAFIALLVVNRLFPLGSEWKEYKAYNDLRTSVYDYVGIFDTDEKALEYYHENGLTDEDISLYKSYDLMLEDEPSESKLQIFSGYSEIKKESYPDRQKLKDAFYIYYRRIFKEGTDAPFDIIVILLYVVAINGAIVFKKKEVLIPVILCGIYRSLFFVFLFYQGRYPERVITALFVMEISFLTAILIDMIKSGSAGKMTVYGYTVILSVAFLYLAFSEIEKLGDRYDYLVSVNNADDVVYSYMESHPENYYFLDVFTTVEHTEKALIKQDMADNHVILGGWILKHPAINSLFDSMGYDSALDALINGDNCYLVTRKQLSPDKEEFEKWLGEKLSFENVISYEGTISVNITSGEQAANESMARTFYVYHVIKED